MGIRLNGNDTKVFNTRHVQHLGLLTLLTIKEQREKKKFEFLYNLAIHSQANSIDKNVLPVYSPRNKI